MAYRVSTWPDGHRTWWTEHDAIPPDHTSIRPSTEDETAIISRIMSHDKAGRMPPTPERTMQVTITVIRGYAGANKRPTRGTATFSDGKTYEWSIHRLTGVPYFFTERLNPANGA